MILIPFVHLLLNIRLGITILRLTRPVMNAHPCCCKPMTQTCDTKWLVQLALFPTTPKHRQYHASILHGLEMIAARKFTVMTQRPVLRVDLVCKQPGETCLCIPSWYSVIYGWLGRTSIFCAESRVVSKYSIFAMHCRSRAAHCRWCLVHVLPDAQVVQPATWEYSEKREFEGGLARISRESLSDQT